MASTSQQRFRDLSISILMLVWMVLWPIVLVLSHRNLTGNFTLMAITSLLVPGAIGSFFINIKDLGKAVLPAALLFGAFILLSSLWAPDRHYAKDGVGVIFLVINGYFLIHSASYLGPLWRDRYFTFALLAIILIGIESLSGGFFRDITPPMADPLRDDVSTARGISAGLFFLPPLGFMLWTGKGAAGILSRPTRMVIFFASLAMLMVGAVRFGIAANILALVSMGLAAVLVLRWPRLCLSLGFVGFALLLVATPFLTLALPPVEVLTSWDEGPASWRMRLAIWKYVGEGVFSDGGYFLWGHGVNATKALTELSPLLRVPGGPLDARLIPTHPHNLFLQIWFEYGLIGTMLGLLLIERTWRWALRFSAGQAGLAAAIGAGLAAFLVFACVETSLWTQWRLVMPLMGIWGLYLARTRGDYGEKT